VRKSIAVFGSVIVGTLLACSSSPTASNPASPGSDAPKVVGEAPCKKIEAPQLISRAGASYPSALRKEGVQGKVVMRALLTAEGELQDVRVMSSPDPRLSELAVAAFRKWRYKPATCAGKPVPVEITSTTSFDLH
jgi:periplasmic protein TonB